MNSSDEPIMYALENKICPLCNKHHQAVIGKDLTTYRISPSGVKEQRICIGAPTITFGGKFKESEIEIEFYTCPYCQETSIKLYDFEHNKGFAIYPISEVKHFTSEIPQNIYCDYSEAKAILNLSPRASAVLSRRCLQAMIHNRWNIDLGNLNKEISNIPSDKITQTERAALNAIRQIGNIGAHPDMIVDIDFNDAELLVNVIEIFLQKWYVDDVNLENLLNKAIKASENKLNEKRKR